MIAGERDITSSWPLTSELHCKRIAVGTPEAAFYFAKLAALSCGATPLRLLRPVSLLRRGWRIRTRPLKEKAAVKYGRTLARGGSR